MVAPQRARGSDARPESPLPTRRALRERRAAAAGQGGQPDARPVPQPDPTPSPRPGPSPSQQPGPAETTRSHPAPEGDSGRRGRLGPLRRRARPRRAGSRVTIRPFRRGDEAGLARVCLRTAADGADATDRHAHPGLPAAVWALPYARFEPDLCLVVDDGTPEGRVSGYVLGTSDTVSFEDWCERAWWPAQRRAYPMADMVEPADREAAALVHSPRRTPARITDRYPAHLHVDLLPHVRGGGWGRRLLEGFMGAAAQADASAVHLGVSETNTRAIGFYARLGFALVERTDGALVLGRPL
ncbi:GNAT family N-acetyltransferase [Aquipuribacter sp. SD81]|uniref:GNAT family N-acetyltransferase n=1 Tax=Aquipuribacter sp. SD81 TaxID=3127703 RepID=UPI003015CBE5